MNVFPLRRVRNLHAILAVAAGLGGMSGCGPSGGPSGDDGGSFPETTLTVAAAASMRFALDDLAAAFRRSRPDIDVTIVAGASGSLFAQIVQRAPFDIFLSADSEYPARLVEEGHVEEAFAYAVGRLVLWAPREAELRVAERGMEVLDDPGLGRVAVANPETAPYGRAATAAIRHYGREDAVSGRLVMAENVAQAVQFVESGAAAIGFVALSLTTTDALKAEGDAWIVPAEAHPPLEHAGVVIPRSPNRAAAEAFRDFLLGSEAREILRRHGFEAPPPPG